jgi:hypothetical protein
MGLELGEKGPPIAGFRDSGAGLRVPNSGKCEAHSPKVSGRYREYSRFRETSARDRVRQPLRGGRGTHFEASSPATGHALSVGGGGPRVAKAPACSIRGPPSGGQ